MYASTESVLYHIAVVIIGMTGHHREHWQDQPTVYIGLRYPRDVRKRRHHRRHRLQQPSAEKDLPSVKPGNAFVLW